MKTIKAVILISLIALLLAVSLLLYPPVRFYLLLGMGRFDRAEAVYLSYLTDSDTLNARAQKRLEDYAHRQLYGYYSGKLTYTRITELLNALSRTKLPQKEVEYCLQAAQNMEAARTAFAQAEKAFASADYARAIPLYRQALIADEMASQRLEEAESLYRSHVLEQAKACMDKEQYDVAKAVLSDGLAVLENDDVDLMAALRDARRMAADAAYAEAMEEARRLLSEEGPGAAIRFMDDLCASRPEEYALAYLKQQLLHEYEGDVLARAKALWQSGDTSGACALLEEGLRWIDSADISMLLGDIRGSIVYLLNDMPILRDGTANPRTGADSTILWDGVMTDIRKNAYVHSLSADLGDIVFDLSGEYAVFAGTVAFPQGEKSDIYRSSATLLIFGDGALLAEFKDVSGASSPIAFTLSVTGVRELTLRWISEGANGWKDWGRFATLFDGRLTTTAPVHSQQD